jgi:hypothetical protein
MSGNGLQKVLVWGVIVVTIETIGGFFVLAALHVDFPAALSGLPALEVGALISGQLFLGHQDVVKDSNANAAATIKTLSDQLVGVANVAAGTPTPPTAAPTSVPGTATGSPASSSGSDATGPIVTTTEAEKG